MVLSRSTALLPCGGNAHAACASAYLRTWYIRGGASSSPVWVWSNVRQRADGFCDLSSSGKLQLETTSFKWTPNLRGPRHRLRKLAATSPVPSRGHSMLITARRSLLNELKNIKDEAEPAVPLEYASPLEIVPYPDPRLRAKNRRITCFDDKLQQLVKEMFDVMYKTDGVGLSAPQVGVNVQLMVYNPEGERGRGQEYVLVNPQIVKYGKNTVDFVEGCLSFPTIHASVERPVTVRVDAQDIKGKKFSINLKDFQARIFQHEYDHLEGILYFDRMTPEVLNSIRQDLTDLEQAYERRTGSPAPERISDRL